MAHINDDFAKGYCAHLNQTECEHYPERIRSNEPDPEADFAFPGARDENHYEEIFSCENRLASLFNYAGYWQGYCEVCDGMTVLIGFSSKDTDEGYRIIRDHFSVKRKDSLMENPPGDI